MNDIKAIVGEVAPGIAKALDTSFSGVALKYMADKLLDGKSGDLSGANLSHLLSDALTDSSKLGQLKELDSKFQEDMKKLDVDIFALEVDDRKSARQLAANDIRPQVIISVIFVIAYFLLLGAVFWAEISPEFNPGMAKIDGKWVPQQESLEDLFKILIGVLTAGIGQVLSFWFGAGKKTTEK